MREIKPRVQVLACKNEINELLQSGYSVSEIFTRLTDAQRLNLSKGHFQRLIKRFCEKPEPLKQIPLPKDDLKKPSRFKRGGQNSRFLQHGGRQENTDMTTFRRQNRELNELT